jgi:hypothetical protein
MKFIISDILLAVVILIASAITGWVLGNVFVHVLESYSFATSQPPITVQEPDHARHLHQR